MGTRARFSSQVSADGRFTELEVQRSLSDVTLAKTHAIGRNRRVGAVLCYLSLMKSRDLVPKGAKAKVVGAEVQNFESEDGYEAAHYLPGQLKISVPGKGDIEPWNLVKNAATASEIASLFSAVQNLHQHGVGLLGTGSNPRALSDRFARLCVVRHDGSRYRIDVSSVTGAGETRRMVVSCRSCLEY